MEPVPPALRYRIRDVLSLLPEDGGALEGLALERLVRLLDDGEPWLGADPTLADIAYWMMEPRQSTEMRRQGCVWATMFPSADTATRLAKIALEASTPEPLREQAIWSLGYRQLRRMHPSTRWAPVAIQIADEALIELGGRANTAGKVTSEKLPLALRHVQADAVFARAPGLWGDALECFATAPLARVLFVSLDDIAPRHRLRVLRLIAFALGDEAVPMLAARARQAGPDERIEMLLLAVTFGGEAQLGKLEDALRDMKYADLIRKRAKWHLQNRGVVPTVRGLRVARQTAVLAPEDRVAKCAAAADDLAALARFARYPEAYVYRLWGWLVRGSGDPVRARELVAAHPESQRLVRDLYFEDLARRGRVKQLAAAAQSLAGADLGAMLLAIHGRPLAALELAATAKTQTPELVCARALACYRAGRPDLTDRVLAEDLPPSEVVGDTALPPFPGPHERWLIDQAPAARPALTALADGRTAVVSLAKPAPDDAEPDTPSIDGTRVVERRLFRGLRGATVYLAGEFKTRDKGAVATALERAGARIVAGPFPDTDYYVHGDWCLVQTIAQLERQGARRLRPGELEGV